MFPALEMWSIIASIVSIILGIIAIGISISFFVVNRNTEKGVSNSLTKIETQAEMLQKLTGKQMDRLTKYVTEQKPDTLESLPQLISIITSLPQTMIAQTQQPSGTGEKDQLIKELIIFYIAMYFYTAQTNYWSQAYLPDINDYDEDNHFHVAVKRIVDISSSDFTSIADILGRCNIRDLEMSANYHLLQETREFWRSHVKSSVDIYIARQKNI